MTDAQLLAEVEATFGSYDRPEHFTNFAHCCECAEHDALLRSRARGQLRTEDVSNAGWNPVCFATNEAFRYLVPDLVRLALRPVGDGDEWSFPNLLFHLGYEGERNRYWSYFSLRERAVIVSVLRHIERTRANDLLHFASAEEVGPVIELWERRA
jgi:hypothetical protein